ncbi:hypothetical protein HY468_04485, partial [Candidatus Roizmanbacteria bacterium]|nr:hypothetical protein [Candidatus Roizmanbacteria bacterium]
ICVLENPTDIVNIGSAIRNISAFGVEKLYIVGGAKNILRDFESSRRNKRLTNISVGANKWVFVKYFDTTSGCITYLRKNLYTIAVTSSHGKKNNVNLYEETFTYKRLAVWFGNESKGISDEAVQSADMCIEIPMGGIVESLNLGTSTGIILSYIGYQRLKFVYSHNKVRFKPRGFANLKMRSWQDFVSNHD